MKNKTNAKSHDCKYKTIIHCTVLLSILHVPRTNINAHTRPLAHTHTHKSLGGGGGGHLGGSVCSALPPPAVPPKEPALSEHPILITAVVPLGCGLSFRRRACAVVTSNSPDTSRGTMGRGASTVDYGPLRSKHGPQYSILFASKHEE